MSVKKLTLFDRLNSLSYPAIFWLWAINILTFATLYVGCTFVPGNGPTGLEGMPMVPRILNAIYYSVITATNTGYGDIAPHGLSRVFAALEAFSGLFLFALFMSKLVSQRQDIAITQMHKLSFEGTFHDIREDLHIVRGDFDKLLAALDRDESLAPAEWNKFSLACQQIANLASEIANFYDREANLYRIDDRRERLLIEAFERTFERLDTLLLAFGEHGFMHKDALRIREQVHQLLTEVESKMMEWQEDAGHEKEMLFAPMQRQLAIVRTHA